MESNVQVQVLVMLHVLMLHVLVIQQQLVKVNVMIIWMDVNFKGIVDVLIVHPSVTNIMEIKIIVVLIMESMEL